MCCRAFSISLILEFSTLVTALLVTNMAIFGSRVASMVRSSYWSKVVVNARIDVINVSGHRLSTAEIESALILHKGVAETAGLCLIDMCSSVADHMHSYRNC